MLIRFLNVLRGGPFTVFFLLSIHLLVIPSTTSAQDEGLTFEQAQTRTAFAREQMRASQLELDEAESREEAALRELAELQKRQDEARNKADKATQERQGAEKKYQEAKDMWSRESARLKRIHQRSIRNSAPR